jgi:hypothetical protein
VSSSFTPVASDPRTSRARGDRRGTTSATRSCSSLDAERLALPRLGALRGVSGRRSAPWWPATSTATS